MATMSTSTVKELSSVERELSIVIEAENVKREIDLAYQRLGSQVKMKGFRPGKVPRQVLEQYYRADVLRDVLNRLLTKSYQEAVTQHDLHTVADPQIDAKEQIIAGNDFSFSARVEVRPEVKLHVYEGLELSIPKLMVSDTEVEKQLESLRDAHASIVPVAERDSILQGDLVECSYSSTVDGKHIKQLSRMNHSIEIGSGKFFPVAEQALVGKKLGEKVECVVNIPDSFEIENLRGKDALMVLAASSIKVKQKPNLDDEFAKDVSEQFATLQDLKNAILENLNKNKEHQENEAKKSAALDALIKQNPFELPQSLVQRQAEQQAMSLFASFPKEQAAALWQEHGEKLVQEARPHAIKTIQSTFLCDAIAKQLNIEVSAEEIETELSREALRLRVSMQKLRSYYKDENMESLKRRLAAEKALSYVIETAKVSFVEPSKND